MTRRQDTPAEPTPAQLERERTITQLQRANADLRRQLQDKTDRIIGAVLLVVLGFVLGRRKVIVLTEKS